MKTTAQRERLKAFLGRFQQHTQRQGGEHNAADHDSGSSAAPSAAARSGSRRAPDADEGVPLPALGSMGEYDSPSSVAQPDRQHYAPQQRGRSSAVGSSGTPSRVLVSATSTTMTAPSRSLALSHPSTPTRQEVIDGLSADMAKAKLATCMRELRVVRDTNAALTSKVMSAHAARASSERRIAELQELVKVQEQVDAENAAKVKQHEQAVAEVQESMAKMQRVHESQLWEEQQSIQGKLEALKGELQERFDDELRRMEAQRDEERRGQTKREEDIRAEGVRALECLKAEHRVHKASIAKETRELEERARKEEAARHTATITSLQERLQEMQEAMAKQDDDFTAERRSHRELLDNAGAELLTAQRSRDEWQSRYEAAERQHAQERAQEAANWQKARQALSEGIQNEVSLRRKAEMNATEKDREVAALQSEIAGLNRIIEQMRKSSEELQRKAEAVVSSAAAESINATEEASKLKALVELNSKAVDAVPRLQKRLEEKVAEVVKANEASRILAKQNNQLREVAEALQEQQAMLGEKVKQHEKEEEAFRVTIEKMRAEAEGLRGELQKYRMLIPKHLQADTADGVAEALSRVPQGLSANNPDVVKAMASPALAAVLARMDGQISTLPAKSGRASEGGDAPASASEAGGEETPGSVAGSSTPRSSASKRPGTASRLPRLRHSGVGGSASPRRPSTTRSPTRRTSFMSLQAEHAAALDANLRLRRVGVLSFTMLRSCQRQQRRLRAAAAFSSWRAMGRFKTVQRQLEEHTQMLAHAEAEVQRLKASEGGSKVEQQARFQAAVASVRNVEQWKTAAMVNKLKTQLDTLLAGNRRKEEAYDGVIRKLRQQIATLTKEAEAAAEATAAQQGDSKRAVERLQKQLDAAENARDEAQRTITMMQQQQFMQTMQQQQIQQIQQQQAQQQQKQKQKQRIEAEAEAGADAEAAAQPEAVAPVQPARAYPIRAEAGMVSPSPAQAGAWAMPPQEEAHEGRASAAEQAMAAPKDLVEQRRRSIGTDSAPRIQRSVPAAEPPPPPPPGKSPAQLATASAAIVAHAAAPSMPPAAVASPALSVADRLDAALKDAGLPERRPSTASTASGDALSGFSSSVLAEYRARFERLGTAASGISQHTTSDRFGPGLSPERAAHVAQPRKSSSRPRRPPPTPQR